jgi:hypothetical protein
MLWPTGPLDVRWDAERKVWVSPPSFKMMKCILDEDLIPEAYGGTSTAQAHFDEEEIAGATRSGGRKLIGTGKRSITVSDYLNHPINKGCKILAYFDPDTCDYIAIAAEFRPVVIMSDMRTRRTRAGSGLDTRQSNYDYSGAGAAGQAQQQADQDDKSDWSIQSTTTDAYGASSTTDQTGHCFDLLAYTRNIWVQSSLSLEEESILATGIMLRDNGGEHFRMEQVYPDDGKLVALNAAGENIPPPGVPADDGYVGESAEVIAVDQETGTLVAGCTIPYRYLHYASAYAPGKWATFGEISRDGGIDDAAADGTISAAESERAWKKHLVRHHNANDEECGPEWHGYPMQALSDGEVGVDLGDHRAHGDVFSFHG